MSLTLATLLPGLLLLLLGLPLVLGHSGYAAVLKGFPRSPTATYLLFGAGAAWFLYGIWHLSPADFGSGYAALRELRTALEEFRGAGKPVQAYLTQATTRTYYVASAADNLALDPYGMILMPGLASQPMFFAGLFEKYGVNVQVTRVGKYKSAVETFTRRDMSPENREEVTQLLGDIWRELLADIARTRRLEPAGIQEVVDREGLIRAQPALEGKLVDRVAYRDEVYDDLKTRTGRAGSKEPFRQVALDQYAKQLKDGGAETGRKAAAKGRIALVYAEGEIVDGEGQIGEIGGSELSRTLRRLRQDPNVKAVVLRVNSPGGSASASEVIQREVRLIREVKPLIVSMGSYAASGGYWISAPADRIFAESSTITGSIGVFGLQFDVQRLAADFGVSFDTVKTGRFADALTITRPKTPEEMAVLQRMVDWIYGEFVAKVAEGRKLTPEQVEAIAQGRVWSGREALARGLVDEIGGLEAAVAHAAKRAGLRLVARSDINANPKDTADHPFGVWTLPPTRATVAYGSGKPADPTFDRSKYDAIGESDRMTLRFTK